MDPNWTLPWNFAVPIARGNLAFWRGKNEILGRAKSLRRTVPQKRYTEAMIPATITIAASAAQSPSRSSMIFRARSPKR